MCDNRRVVTGMRRANPAKPDPQSRSLSGQIAIFGAKHSNEQMLQARDLLRVFAARERNGPQTTLSHFRLVRLKIDAVPFVPIDTQCPAGILLAQVLGYPVTQIPIASFAPALPALPHVYDTTIAARPYVRVEFERINTDSATEVVERSEVVVSLTDPDNAAEPKGLDRAFLDGQSNLPRERSETSARQVVWIAECFMQFHQYALAVSARSPRSGAYLNYPRSSLRRQVPRRSEAPPFHEPTLLHPRAPQEPQTCPSTCPRLKAVRHASLPGRAPR